MIIFSIVTTLTAGSLAKVCVPSQVTLLLKLRSGVIPTFRDRNFASYRQATDAVTKIGGSLFWGSILASLFIGGIFALLFIGSNDVSNVLDISTRADLHLGLGF